MHVRIRRGFTLAELLVVIVVMAVLISVLLPALSSARKSAIMKQIGSGYSQRANTQIELLAGDQGKSTARALAQVRATEARIDLTPKLSVGTAEPESIYEAKFSAKITAIQNAQSPECEIHLPLPPQIISLSDLTVTVGGQPSESVAMRDDRLVWTGKLTPEPTQMEITYSAVGKGLYTLQTPPGGILDLLKIELTAHGSDVRMLELSMQPTKTHRGADQTSYTWDYKRLLFGRPIALDVLGIAPIDRLGELRWLGAVSLALFGLVVGLVAKAYNIERFDRWMLVLVLGTFTGGYPLMYFAQEYISLTSAVAMSAGLVLLVIAVRCVTIMGVRLGLLGVVMPAMLIMAITLTAALRPGYQGLLLTGEAIALLVGIMVLVPRLQRMTGLAKPAPVTTRNQIAGGEAGNP